MLKKGYLLVTFIVASTQTNADGLGIDKVYDPYVQPFERELEYRSTFFNNPANGDLSIHRLGFGYGFSERVSGEVYVIAEKAPDESLELEAVELEAKWQLTEQGEYNADWGLLLELEDEHGMDAFEFSSTAIVGKDFGNWTATGNLALIYEWGGDITDEFETSFAGQWRYRWRESFEPAIELYRNEEVFGMGPIARGLLRLSPAKKMRWEAGIIFGLDDESPDSSVRVLVEYEF